eukprot:1140805-Amphidinium_carterae.3
MHIEKADVLAIKRAVSQTRQCMLVMVAVALDSSEWYTRCMMAYIKDLPGAKEHVPIMRGLQQQLGGMIGLPTVATVSELHGMVQRAFPLQSALREGSPELNKVKADLLEKIKTYCKGTLQSVAHQGDRVAICEGMVNLLVDAVILYSQDADLPTHQCAIASVVKSEKQ